MAGGNADDLRWGLSVPGRPTTPSEGRAQHYYRPGPPEQQDRRVFDNGTTLQFGPMDPVLDANTEDPTFHDQLALVDRAVRDCKAESANESGDPFANFRSELLQPNSVEWVSKESGQFPRVPSKYASVVRTPSVFATTNKSDTPGLNYSGHSVDTRFGVQNPRSGGNAGHNTVARGPSVGPPYGQTTGPPRQFQTFGYNSGYGEPPQGPRKFSGAPRTPRFPNRPNHRSSSFALLSNSPAPIGFGQGVQAAPASYGQGAQPAYDARKQATQKSVTAFDQGCQSAIIPFNQGPQGAMTGFGNGYTGATALFGGNKGTAASGPGPSAVPNMLIAPPTRTIEAPALSVDSPVSESGDSSETLCPAETFEPSRPLSPMIPAPSAPASFAAPGGGVFLGSSTQSSRASIQPSRAPIQPSRAPTQPSRAPSASTNSVFGHVAGTIPPRIPSVRKKRLYEMGKTVENNGESSKGNGKGNEM